MHDKGRRAAALQLRGERRARAALVSDDQPAPPWARSALRHGRRWSEPPLDREQRLVVTPREREAVPERVQPQAFDLRAHPAERIAEPYVDEHVAIGLRAQHRVAP